MNWKMKNRIKFAILDGDGGGEGGDGGNVIDTGGSEYDFNGMVGEGGNFSENWRDGLSEELRDDATLRSISNVDQMAKMLVSGQKMIGQKRTALPGADGTEEAWNKFYTDIGRPETADKYEIDTQSVSPEMKDLVEGDMGWYKETAHKHGLTGKQAQELFNDYQAHNNEKLGEMRGQQDVVQKQQLDQLRNEWGSEEQFNENVGTAKQALNMLGMKDAITDAGLGDNVAVIKLLHAFGSQISGDKLHTGESGALQGVQAEIDSIMGDQESPYWNGSHPRHKELVNRVFMLNSKLG